jgi:hypothetical protein
MFRNRGVSTFLLAIAAWLLAAPAAHGQDTVAAQLHGRLYTQYRWESIDANNDNSDISQRAARIEIVEVLLDVQITPTIIGRVSLLSEPISSFLTREPLHHEFRTAWIGIRADKVVPHATIRAGRQPGVYLNFVESFYAYRFQGRSLLEAQQIVVPTELGLAGDVQIIDRSVEIAGGMFTREQNEVDAPVRDGFQIRGSARLGEATPNTFGSYFVTVAYDGTKAAGVNRRFALAGHLVSEKVRGGLEFLRAFTATTHVDSYTGWAEYSLTSKDSVVGRLERLSRPERGQDARTLIGVAHWLARESRWSAGVMVDFENRKENGVEGNRVSLSTGIVF